MVHKLQLAANQLASYTSNMSAPSEPLDTHITDTEAKVSISILVILGTLVLLNVFFYFLFKRIRRKQDSTSTTDRDRNLGQQLSITSRQNSTATQTTQTSLPSSTRSYKSMGDIEMRLHRKSSIEEKSLQGYWSDSDISHFV